MDNKQIFAKLEELQREGSPACLATVIKTSGSTPREVSAKMLICPDGVTFGTIGGGCGEKQAVNAGSRALFRARTVQPEIIEIDLTDDLGVKGGDVCGGKMLVLIETFFKC